MPSFVDHVIAFSALLIFGGRKTCAVQKLSALLKNRLSPSNEDGSSSLSL
uniref:Uncharacterized protein n=1 Tax=Anguilla anguilla TaxID=7936 RepID=A0A0E9RNL7_ANGAN